MMDNCDGEGRGYEKKRKFLQRLYEAVWDMNSVKRSSQVLAEIEKGLVEIGIDFQSCGVYAVDERGGKPIVRYHDMSPGGEWCVVAEEEEKEWVLPIWTEGVTVDWWNLEQNGRCEEELLLMRRCGHPVQAGMLVPFTQGLLGVFSEEPGVFSEWDVKFMDQVALALSTMFHRLADLDLLKAKEQQLRQVQRLQLVGQLTAEMAHEINNPLSVVAGECDLLLMDEQLEPHLLEGLSAISKASLQAQTVSKRLLDFVRGQKADMEWLNFNRLVQDALVLMHRSLKKEDIELEEDLTRNLPWIEAHAGQIQQVVINLIKNSQDAIRGFRVQGVVRVRTCLRGDRVVLEVEDNGPGIPEEIRERVFDPFFTTKEDTKGTGLGLNVCAGIAKEHNGELRLEPRLLGTCMVMELPIRQTPVSATN